MLFRFELTLDRGAVPTVNLEMMERFLSDAKDAGSAVDWAQKDDADQWPPHGPTESPPMDVGAVALWPNEMPMASVVESDDECPSTPRSRDSLNNIVLTQSAQSPAKSPAP